ncbi:putative arabinosyltransferase A [Gordonia crocea]|uniref:Putative arabinosyltransferase A n=1 Tax=Gordonia crocea TaxID=589162 RepID=A0A7M3SUM0_9ACTN|nr:arabinosyltransferase domain-containing protein [Gordonia crocea]GED96344.1 putative arabinosyltransferase A [Gordonia crocea]
MRLARLVAVGAGIVGILACLLTPLLPVNAVHASFTWPQGQQLDKSSSVTAPLIAQTAKSVDITIPCSVLASLPAEPTTVLTTMSPGAPGAPARMLSVKAGDTITVMSRNALLASAPRTDLARCSRLVIHSDAAGPRAQFVGLGPVTTAAPSAQPQIDGIFSPLPAATITRAGNDGLAAKIDIDNRYESTPSLIKRLVMILGLLAVIASLVALGILDRASPTVAAARDEALADEDATPRTGFLASLRPRLSDLAVTAALLVWGILAGGGPDDGYILNMGRVAGEAGYLPNYYRFFGIAEAPFSWYYDFLSHWSSVSASMLWMHLPSLVAGLVSWYILSRILLPRMGSAVSHGWPVWAAAAVFTAFWMPLCSGLRSESVIVLGSLLTWWAIESAITSKRLLPVGLAVIAAAFTFAAAPHGVIGIAILLVGARALLAIAVARRREIGWAAILAPIFAAGLVVLLVVFGDQTLATVAEAMKIRYQVGPNLPWFQEYLRYYFLTVTTPDASLARRVPVLLLLASAFVTVAVLLRRGQIDGVRGGPAWRAVGAIGVTMILMVFTPTKWTIQFGIYAGLAAAVAATATLAVAQSAARSTRNLTVFVSGLMFALAAATAGKNAWPYFYDFGISWFDRAPVIAGTPMSTIFLILAVATGALAAWQHLRLDYAENTGLEHHDAEDLEGVADRETVVEAKRHEAVANRIRLIAAGSPIAVIAGGLVVLELALFAKAAVARYPVATAFSTNIGTLRGQPCGLAEKVLVEPDANTGMLTPATGHDASRALAGDDPVGFTPDGITTNLSAEMGSSRPGQAHVAGSSSKPFAVMGTWEAGTTGGRGPRTVNGSIAALPYGLNPASTPVLGSYGFNGEARLTSDWYRMPDRASSPLLVVTAAGSISTVDAFGARTFGQSLRFQFGKRGPNGQFEEIGAPVTPIDPGPVIPNRPWRNLRVPMSAAPPAADVVRLVALDNNLGTSQFIMLTPPRAPRVVTLQHLVGSTDPTLIDFMVAAHFPCQRPMGLRHGVAEIPQWRILPDYAMALSQSRTWQNAAGGGLLGISEATTSATAVPTYLDGDWHRGWGALERLTPRDPQAAPAAVATDIRKQWGWSRTGSIRLEPGN